VVRVKLCGITSVEDAQICVEAGADALGFIFVEGTPRFVTPAQARAVIATLPPFVTPVGVFWDHPTEECGLAALQFHGDESPEDLAQHRLPVIKTIKVEGPAALERMRRYAAAAIMLDSPARWSEGEARTPISWSVAHAATAAGHRVILSAGLTPDNVAEAVRMVRPYAVDVNSGVEACPGVKDPDKVRRFVAAAKEA
jgi:phosphoribosylanthranilate isomerase